MTSYETRRRIRNSKSRAAVRRQYLAEGLEILISFVAVATLLGSCLFLAGL